MKLSKKRNPNEQNYSAVKQRRNNVTIGGLMADDPRESAVNRRGNGGLMEGNQKRRLTKVDI